MSRDKPPQTSGTGLEQCGPRRLPLYFLLDFSGAPVPGVAAAAREQVRQIIARLQLLAANREDYQGAPVYYTIIVFRTSAIQLHPMAPPWAYPFVELRLEAIEPQGEPGFAAAFDALGRSCEHELKMPGADNGDSQPLAFLFTDCFRPGNWEKPPAAKWLVCAMEPPPSVRTVSHPAPEFLPFESQAQIMKIIEEERNRLKLRQHMIDYPTSY